MTQPASTPTPAPQPAGEAAEIAVRQIKPTLGRMMPIFGRGEYREQERVSEIVKDGQTSIVMQVPFALLHEAQAMRNHSQSLDKLAKRGGLSRCEAVAIMDARAWQAMPEPEANARLNVAISQMEPSDARR